jgi:hypothetical protein
VASTCPAGALITDGWTMRIPPATYFVVCHVLPSSWVFFPYFNIFIRKLKKSFFLRELKISINMFENALDVHPGMSAETPRSLRSDWVQQGL